MIFEFDYNYQEAYKEFKDCFWVDVAVNKNWANTFMESINDLNAKWFLDLVREDNWLTKNWIVFSSSNNIELIYPIISVEGSQDVFLNDVWQLGYNKINFDTKVLLVYVTFYISFVDSKFRSWGDLENVLLKRDIFYNDFNLSKFEDSVLRRIFQEYFISKWQIDL